MTIVLQHQFWDLAVGEEAFEVGLSFGGIAERLAVPFDAITAFFDPAVQFGFQFETVEGEGAQGTQGGDARVAAPRSSASQPASPRLPAETAKPEPLPAPAAAAPPQEPAPDGSGGGAEVVRLDRFRKK